MRRDHVARSLVNDLVALMLERLHLGLHLFDRDAWLKTRECLGTFVGGLCLAFKESEEVIFPWEKPTDDILKTHTCSV